MSMMNGTQIFFLTNSMAYYTKKTRFQKSRKGGFKKKTYYKPKKVPMEALPKAVIPEMKRHAPTVINGTNMSTLGHAPLVQNSFSIGGGVNESDRIGNKILARGLMIRGAFFNRNSNNKGLVARLAIIQDREADSITPFDGDQALVNGNGNVDLSTLSEQACFLPWNKYRYRVFYDQTFRLSPENVNANDYKQFKKFIKLNMPVMYGGSGAGSLKSKPVQVVMWATDPSSSAIDTENITAYCDTTLYYNDA